VKHLLAAATKLHVSAAEVFFGAFEKQERDPYILHQVCACKYTLLSVHLEPDEKARIYIYIYIYKPNALTTSASNVL
jgi:hypothetical protein